MKTTRTDCHAPSSIDPAAYEFEECFYQYTPAHEAMWAGIEWIIAEKKRIKALMAAEGWQGGNYATKKTCDHCGAHFNYGAIFRHTPTNELIVVGWICAEKTMNVGSRAALEYKRLVERVHNMRAHVKVKSALTRRKNELLALYPDMAEMLCTNHKIVQDIKARFEQTGYLSVSQMDLVRKLHGESLFPETKNEPTWLPVEEGRRDLQGKVLAKKIVDGQYGQQTKLLIQIDREEGAEKVWVTMPASLFNFSVQKGVKVGLTCTVERSFKDPTFGIGKRPTGGVVLTN